MGRTPSTPNAVNRADLLILLEDGPHGATQLATWLRQPSARVLWELKRMAREGLVRRVGPDKRWAPANFADPIPPAASPAASAVGRAPQRSEAAATATRAVNAVASRSTVPPLEGDADSGFDFADDVAEVDDESSPDSAEIDALLAPPSRRPGRPKLRQEEPVSATSREPGWWVKHAAPTDTAREGFIADAKVQFDTRFSRQHTPSKLFPNQMGGFS